MAIILFLLLPHPAEAATIARPLPGQNYVLLHKKPKTSSKRKALSSITRSGRRRSLLVLRQRPGWIGLRAPWRPSRKTFWGRRSRFHLHSVSQKLVLDRSRRVLSFWGSGKRRWRARVVVGRSSTPTPLGKFALHDFYRTGGDLRPWVFETTAQSPAIRSWLGGEARIALHGRHGSLWAPWGSASSNGCIRTPDWALRKIRRRAEIGMPIHIRR